MSTSDTTSGLHEEREPMQYYYKNLAPAGLGFYRSNATSFIEEGPLKLEFEREPSNPHDPNAIAIYGISGAEGRVHRRQIGYVPAEVASEIVNEGLFSVLSPYLEYWKIYEDTGYCWVNFHINGPIRLFFEFKTSGYRKFIKDHCVMGVLKLPTEVHDVIDLGNALVAVRDHSRAAMCFEDAIRKLPSDETPYEFLRLKFKREKLRFDEVRVIQSAISAFTVAAHGKKSGHAVQTLKRYQQILDKIPKKYKNEPNKALEPRSWLSRNVLRAAHSAPAMIAAQFER